ncbi:MAG: efflux RND transporter periplasmic adaptor subunit [Pseudomonadota bacterium]
MAWANAQPAAAQNAPAPALGVAPAERSDLRATAVFSGRLVAAQKVDIQARVSGFLEEIAFEEGARVSAGDLLYRIEDDPYTAALGQVDGQIAAAAAERRLAEIERDRKQQLVERQTVAQSELDVAEANLGRADGEIARLQAERARAELDVDYTAIQAPFDGVMSLNACDIGAFVGPDSGALVTLTRLNPMTVEFPVATALVLDYRRQAVAGQTGSVSVTLQLPDGTTYDRAGRIDFVDAEVDAGTDTVTVRAVFANPDGLLIDGALVSVALRGDTPQEVLNVPSRAISRDQIGAFVLVVDDASIVELRRVEVTRSTDGRSVITSGLEAGENVIVDGLNKVRPGLRVDAAVANTTGG